MNLKRELLNLYWRLQPRATWLTVAGRRYRLPLQRGADRAAAGALREPWLDAILRAECGAAGAVLLDVGANCGQTLLRAAAINPRLRYLGCEPNPTAAGYLQALVAGNRLPNCTVLCCALAARPGVGRLTGRTPVDPSATLIANFRAPEPSLLHTDVLLEVGDQLLEHLAIERLDLVKIDVEGGEAEALHGLERSLRRHRPVVVCEVLRSHTPDHPSHGFRQASKRDLEQFFAALGYQSFGIADDGTVAAVEQLSDRFLNYLFRPR